MSAGETRATAARLPVLATSSRRWAAGETGPRAAAAGAVALLLVWRMGMVVAGDVLREAAADGAVAADRARRC